MLSVKKIYITGKRHKVLTVTLLLCVGLIAAAGIYTSVSNQPNTLGNESLDDSLAISTNLTPEESRDLLVSRQEREAREATSSAEKISALLGKAAALGSSDKKGAISAYKSAEKIDKSDPRPSMAMCNFYFFEKNESETKLYCQKSIKIIESNKESAYNSNIEIYKKMIIAAEQRSFSDHKDIKELQP